MNCVMSLVRFDVGLNIRVLESVQPLHCLVLALGDCLGSPVECRYWDGIEPGTIMKHFIKYREQAGSQKPKLIKYTDDTAMVNFDSYLFRFLTRYRQI